MYPSLVRGQSKKSSAFWVLLNFNCRFTWVIKESLYSRIPWLRNVEMLLFLAPTCKIKYWWSCFIWMKNKTLFFQGAFDVFWFSRLHSSPVKSARAALFSKQLLFPIASYYLLVRNFHKEHWRRRKKPSLPAHAIHPNTEIQIWIWDEIKIVFKTDIRSKFLRKHKSSLFELYHRRLVRVGVMFQHIQIINFLDIWFFELDSGSISKNLKISNYIFFNRNLFFLKLQAEQSVSFLVHRATIRH